MINKLMKQFIKKLHNYSSPKKTINIELNYLFKNIYPRIIEVEDLILRSELDQITIDKEFILSNFGSFSAYEDYENHIHIVDIFNCSLMQTLKFGLILKDILSWKLKNDFPASNFIVTLFFDNKNKENTILRFYKYREYEKELYSESFIEDQEIGILLESI